MIDLREWHPPGRFAGVIGGGEEIGRQPIVVREERRRLVTERDHRATGQRDEEQHLAVGVGVHRQAYRLAERHTVGGAQKLVTPSRSIASISATGSNLVKL